jgi:hypothetical protein
MKLEGNLKLIFFLIEKDFFCVLRVPLPASKSTYYCIILLGITVVQAS